jgi:hypothetical protein
MTICSSQAAWDFMGCRTETTPEAHDVLNRIRRGDPVTSILLDHPHLTQAQIGLAWHRQNQEQELNRLYSKLQDVERLKMQVERDLATSLLRAMHQSTASHCTNRPAARGSS